MKPTETDSRVIDYLYGDLPEEARQAVRDSLEPEAQEDLRAYQQVVTLYRQECAGVEPRPEGTERLLEEARSASRPFLSRLLGSVLPAFVLRPSVALATMAILALGVGVFAFLSNRGPEPGRSVSSQEVSNIFAPRRSEESAPTAGARSAAAPASSLAEAADQPGFGAEDMEAERAAAAEASDEREQAVALLDGIKGGRDDALGQGRSLAPGEGGGAMTARRKRALPLKAAEKTAGADKRKTVSARGKARRRTSTLRGVLGGSQSQPGSGADRKAQSAGEQPARLAKPYSLGGYLSRGGGGARVPPRAAKSGPQPSAAKGGSDSMSQSPRSLHNQARTIMHKGKIDQACNLYALLVRTYRDYPRRADALLGWARCEMSRGSFALAEALIRRIQREHPKWHKTATALLAQLRTKQRVAKRQAEARARRRAAARRAAPAASQRQRRKPARAPSTSKH